MPANEYYVHSSGQPTQQSRGSSAAIRGEFDAIEAAFYKIGQKVAESGAAADFKLIYQGARATDPTSRYNGTQLQNGDLYFNTNSKVMKSFADGQWYALATTSSVMLISGGTFTGPIAGTSANFSSSVTAQGFIGSGAGLTSMTAAQIIGFLAFTPVNKAGDTMGGPLNGTTMTMSGAVTASDFIMSSDERRKMKWEEIDKDVLERFAKVKKVGIYVDKKEMRRRVGAGAQSMAKVLPEFACADKDGQWGLNYGAAALTILQKAVQRMLEQEKRIAKLEKQLAKKEK